MASFDEEAEFSGRDLPEGYVVDPRRPLSELGAWEKLRLAYQTGSVDPAATRDGGRAWTGQRDDRRSR